MTVNDVPGLVRREIEALCIQPFLEAFAEQIGWERTMEIAGQVIDRLAFQAGQDYAQALDGDLLDAVRDQLLSHNQAGDCDNRLVEQDEHHVTIHTVDCAYVRMYEQIGMPELGYLLSCRRDVGFYQGISPHLRLVRQGTRMQGCSVCDFCIQSD